MKREAEPNYVSNHRDYDYDSESRLHCYRATMAIDNRYEDEVVDGATNFQKGRDSRVRSVKSY